MFELPRARALYFSLLRTPLLLLYSIIIGINISMIFGWWLLFYNPCAQEIDQLYVHILSLHDQTIKNKKQYQQLQLQKVTVPTHQKNEQSSTQAHQSERCALADLMDLATNAGMNVSSCRLTDNKGIIFQACATFEQTISFFESVTKNNVCMNCANISISHAQNKMFNTHAQFVRN